MSDPTTYVPPDAATAEGCRVDSECDDGEFCNGYELCEPGSPDADDRGCVAAAEPACAPGLDCVERTETCVWRCADLDGDGQRSASCGGNDCDDDDPTRLPGAAEVCDPSAHDEDCDTSTFGVRDLDEDGDADARCCNVLEGGERHCGRDCDDANPFVNSTNPEICDGSDNDCDGSIDEEAVPVPWYRDQDGDGFGLASDAIESCMVLPGRVLDATDCDDLAPRRRPGATETCDRLDEDCDGEIDEAVRVGVGGACTVPGASGACATGTVACTASGLACAPAASATAETCNGLDDDCDGRFDEGVPGIGLVCTVPGAHGVCRAGRTACTSAGIECRGPSPGPELCTPDNENCDASENGYDGFACVAGTREACDACGAGLGGERRCDSGCTWSACTIDVGMRRWNGSDPALRHAGGHAEGTDWVLTCADAPASSSVLYELEAALPPGRYQAFHSYHSQWGDEWTSYVQNGQGSIYDATTGAMLTTWSDLMIAFSVGPGCSRVRLVFRGHACMGSMPVRLHWVELRRVGS